MTGRYDIPWPQASLQGLLGGPAPPEGAYPLLTFNLGDRIPGDFSGLAVQYHAYVPADKVYWAYPYSPGKSKLLFKDTYSFLAFRFWAKMKPEFATLDKALAEGQGEMWRNLDGLGYRTDRKLEWNALTLGDRLREIARERGTREDEDREEDAW